MPIDREHGRSDRLLQQLGHPPVVLFVERTDRNRAGRLICINFIDDESGGSPCTTRYSKLVFLGTPSDMGGGSVNPQ
jgi:hypothetical protein